MATATSNWARAAAFVASTTVQQRRGAVPRSRWVTTVTTAFSHPHGTCGGGSTTLHARRIRRRNGPGAAASAAAASAVRPLASPTPRMHHTFLSLSSSLSSSSSCTALFFSSSSLSSSSSPYGTGMDQTAMMETDQLVIVDEFDRLVVTSGAAGTVTEAVTATKKEGHVFNSESPRGILHRAFSVFLFDEQDRLLLTKRAAAKITFPNVWTNACCSHPLQGMVPNEVDDYANVDVLKSSMEGIKNAVVRKLQHELGIPMHQVDKDRLVFVKRFHYWASDAVTYGNQSPWGEHEIDYVFFYKAPFTNESDVQAATASGSSSSGLPPPLSIRANPEEVASYEFVTKDELMGRMRMHQQVNGNDVDDDEVLWSPWFVGIMERGGFQWWEDMEQTLQGRYTSPDITYFDPPARHVATYNLPHHDRTTGVGRPLSSSPAQAADAATAAKSSTR